MVGHIHVVPPIPRRDPGPARTSQRSQRHSQNRHIDNCPKYIATHDHSHNPIAWTSCITFRVIGAEGVRCTRLLCVLIGPPGRASIARDIGSALEADPVTKLAGPLHGTGAFICDVPHLSRYCVSYSDVQSLETHRVHCHNRQDACQGE